MNVDHEPKPITHKEVDATGDTEVNTLQYYRRGKIRWTLPGNTDEKNESLGVLNMRVLLLQKIPEFAAFPLIDGQIAPQYLEAAKSVVIKECGCYTTFVRLFGKTPTLQPNTPYFSGSHNVALEKALASFGIEYKAEQEKNQQQNTRSIVSGKSDEVILENMRRVFFEKFPDFEYSFLAPNPVVQAENLGAAKQFILERIPHRKEFIALFGWVHRRNPAFQGSYIQAIQAVFKPLGIEFSPTDFDQYPHRNATVLKKKTEDEIIASQQERFIQKFPEVQSIIVNLQTGLATENELKKFILSKVGTYKKFLSVFSASLLDSKKEYYFGSFKIALMRIFSSWGVRIDEGDFLKRRLKMPEGRVKKPRNYWTPEQVEKEALEVYEKEGHLSDMALRIQGRWDLINAIRVYGGIRALKNKIAINTLVHKEEIVSSQDADEALGRLIS